MIAPYIIDPFNKYKVAWDMLIGIIYLVTLILDPIILAFNFVPLLHLNINVYTALITWLIIIDMILVLVTGLPRDVTDI